MNPALTDIKIYSPSDKSVVLLTAPVTDRCERNATLMGEDYVKLTFMLAESHTLPAFAMIEYGGVPFFLKEEYKPSPADGCFSYEVKFNSFANLLEKFTCMRYLDVDGKQWSEPEIPINGTIETLCDIIEESIHQTSKRLPMCEYARLMASLSIGDVVSDTKLENFSFSGESIWNVITQVAETFETEWDIEFDGDAVKLNFVKVERGDVLHLSDEFVETDDKLCPVVSGGLTSVEYASEWSNVTQRLLPYGSDKNMVRKDVVQVVGGNEMNVSYGKRLRLEPNKTYHVKNADGSDAVITTDAIGALEVSGVTSQKEQVEMYDDIYPRCHYIVTDVNWIGNADNPTYLIDCLALHADGTQMTEAEMVTAGIMPIQVAEGLTLSITFESGFLNGRDFEVNWTKSYKVSGKAEWHMILAIVPDGDASDGSQIPMGALVPRVGDKFQMFNMVMPDGYISVAIEELAQKAYEDLVAIRDTRPDVKCHTEAFMFGRAGYEITIGQRVAVKSDLFGNSEYVSRCISFSYSLTTPNDVDFNLCSSRIQGTLRTLQAAIADVTSSVGGLNQRQINLSRRGWYDAAEMANMLDSLASEMMLVGNEKYQFAYTSAITCVQSGSAFSHLSVGEGTLAHTQMPYTGWHNGIWIINPQSIYADMNGSPLASSPDVAFYAYADVDEAKPNAVVVLSRNQLNDENHLLIGILSSEFEGNRVFNRTNGYTQIAGGTITTEQIQDAGRNLIIDFQSNPPRIIARGGAIIEGNMKFVSATDDKGEDVLAKLGVASADAKKAIEIAEKAAEKKNYYEGGDIEYYYQETKYVKIRNLCYLQKGTYSFDRTSETISNIEEYHASSCIVLISGDLRGFDLEMRDLPDYKSDVVGVYPWGTTDVKINTDCTALLVFADDYATIASLSYQLEPFEHMVDGEWRINGITIVSDYSDAVQTAIVKADEALATLENMAADNKLTPQEKLDVKREYEQIVSSHTKYDAQALEYGVSVSSYDSAYNALSTYLNPLIGTADLMKVTSNIVRDTFNSRFKGYYDAEIELLKDMDSVEVGGENLYTNGNPTLSTNADVEIMSGLPAGRYVFSAFYTYMGGSVSLKLRSSGGLLPIATFDSGDSGSRVSKVFECADNSLLYLRANNGGSTPMSDIMVQKGVKPTAYQAATKLITGALKGSTEVEGGLILSNLIMLRNQSNAVTAGMSGLTNSTDGTTNDNVLMWGGGTYFDAISDTANGTNKLPVVVTKNGVGSKIGCLSVVSKTEVEVVSSIGKVIIDTSEGGVRLLQPDGRGGYTDKIVILPKNIGDSGFEPMSSGTKTISESMQDVSSSIGEFVIGDFYIPDDSLVTFSQIYVYALGIKPYNNLGSYVKGSQIIFGVKLRDSSGVAVTNAYVEAGPSVTYNDDWEENRISSNKGNITATLQRGKYTLYGYVQLRSASGGAIGVNVQSFTGRLSCTYKPNYTPRTIVGLDGIMTAYDADHYFEVINASGGQKVVMLGLPTSATTKGQLYNSGGTIKVVQ